MDTQLDIRNAGGDCGRFHYHVVDSHYGRAGAAELFGNSGIRQFAVVHRGNSSLCHFHLHTFSCSHTPSHAVRRSQSTLGNQRGDGRCFRGHVDTSDNASFGRLYYSSRPLEA
ncbi:hypothetical protein VTO42DRAFT_5999 [Malbranchea cinnamomea]